MTADPRGARRSGARFGPLAPALGVAQRAIRRWIVPLDAAVDAVPFGGRVLEIGCGEGLVLERLLGRADEVIGVDLDERKIGSARARLPGPPRLRLECADAFAFLSTQPEASFDAALLVDTLSAFDTADQVRLLGELTRVLRPGGALIVKAIDTSPRWKASLSRRLSGFVCGALRMSLSAGQRFTYLPSAELADALERAGAAATIRHLHRERHHPIPHVLVVARKGVA